MPEERMMICREDLKAVAVAAQHLNDAIWQELEVDNGVFNLSADLRQAWIDSTAALARPGVQAVLEGVKDGRTKDG